MSAAVTFINARLTGQRHSSLRVMGEQIAGIGANPEPGDRVVDLHGDRILPGLINTHDHLQLNSLRPLNFDRRYAHVREWIADINGLRESDSEFEASVAVQREQRLLIGGIKNLLSGVTTVAHHDPLYAYLLNPDFPTQVVTEYGWSHSLYIDGEQQVREGCQRTPVERPWIIHAAEGLDAEAANEFERLDALGCLRANTLIVHGVALDSRQRARLLESGAGLVWCPSSNLRLFGRSAQVNELIAEGRVALGTDSRLSGDSDLLEELRVAADLAQLDEKSLESLVTSASARLLRLPDRGSLRRGARADLVVIPGSAELSRVHRFDIRLVMFGGRARYGDRSYAQPASPSTDWADIRVDGRAKVLDARIVNLLSAAVAKEPGVDLADSVDRVDRADRGDEAGGASRIAGSRFTAQRLS